MRISVKGTLYLLAAAVTLISAAQAAEEKVIRIGFNPGPYKEQFEQGVAPWLIKQGYKIEYKDFSDGIQVNDAGNESNLLIVFYVQIMPDDFVMQLHRF